jgi:hypothetical protein
VRGSVAFFQKKQYATWFHPRSCLSYQHDVWLVSKPDLKKVGEAGRRPRAAVDSDRTPRVGEARRAAPQRAPCSASTAGAKKKPCASSYEHLRRRRRRPSPI